MTRFYSSIWQGRLTALFFMLVIFMIFTCIQPLQAQWEEVLVPEEYGITCAIAFNDTDGKRIALVGTDGYTFRSTDQSPDWLSKMQRTNLWITPISFAYTGSKVVATNGREIHNSTDFGLTWEKVLDVPKDTFGYYYITDMANLGHTLFASADSGVFLSKDDGVTWERSVPPIPGFKVACLEVSRVHSGEAMIYAGTSSGTFGHGVYVSSDTGKTWQAANNGYSNVRIVDVTSIGDDVYAACYDQYGVIRSTDFGATWTEVNNGLPIDTAYLPFRFTSLKADGSNLYATANLGVYRSTNDGQRWTRVPSSSLPHGAQHMFHFSVLEYPVSTTTLLGGYSGYSATSDDNGNSWALAEFPPVTFKPSVNFPNKMDPLATTSTRLLVAPERYTGDQRLIISSDEGETWNKPFWQYGGMVDLNAVALFDSTIFVSSTVFNITEPYQEHAISGSNDLGESWFNMSGNLQNMYAAGLTSIPNPPSDDIVFCGTTDFIYRSFDMGATWYKLDKGAHSGMKIGEIISAGGDNGLSMYAGAFNANTQDSVYFSPDKGYTWKAITRSLPSYRLMSLAALPSNDGSPSVFAGTLAGNIYATDNNGASWTDVSPGTDSTAVYNLCGVGPNLFAALNDVHGVYLSSDLGKTWQRFAEGLPDGTVAIKLGATDSYLFAMTNRGLFRRPLVEMLPVDVQATPLPSSFTVHQNYPNPFNPGTQIEYELPATTVVTIRVTDALGRTVLTTDAGIQSAGMHSWHADLTGRPSGLYFYSVRAGDAVQTKKMMLVK